MNDGIDPKLCSLQYTSVEKVARVAQKFGEARCWLNWMCRLHIARPDLPRWPPTAGGVKWGDACDNQAAGYAIAAWLWWYCMCFLRGLFFLEAFCQFELMASHVPRIIMGWQVIHSHNQLSSFLLKVPQASKEPTAIPPQLPQVLLDPSLDCTSPSWTQWFNSVVRMDSQSPPTRHTE